MSIICQLLSFCHVVYAPASLARATGWYTHDLTGMIGLQTNLEAKLTRDEADLVYSPLFNVVDGGGA